MRDRGRSVTPSWGAHSQALTPQYARLLTHLSTVLDERPSGIGPRPLATTNARYNPNSRSKSSSSQSWNGRRSARRCRPARGSRSLTGARIVSSTRGGDDQVDLRAETRDRSTGGSPGVGMTTSSSPHRDGRPESGATSGDHAHQVHWSGREVSSRRHRPLCPGLGAPVPRGRAGPVTGAAG